MFLLMWNVTQSHHMGVANPLQQWTVASPTKVDKVSQGYTELSFQSSSTSNDSEVTQRWSGQVPCMFFKHRRPTSCSCWLKTVVWKHFGCLAVGGISLFIEMTQSTEVNEISLLFNLLTISIISSSRVGWRSCRCCICSRKTPDQTVRLDNQHQHRKLLFH